MKINMSEGIAYLALLVVFQTKRIEFTQYIFSTCILFNSAVFVKAHDVGGGNRRSQLECLQKTNILRFGQIFIINLHSEFYCAIGGIVAVILQK